jgi:AcrR family transcriptional regulator
MPLRDSKGGSAKEKPTPATARQFKRRAEIIDAAAQVFAEFGYSATSTQNIAEVLGLRQASLYYYFRSKDDALSEVCLIGVQGFLEELEVICESGRGFDEKVRAGILNHLMPLREKRAYVRVFLRDRHRITGPGRKEVGKVTRRYEKLWQDLIEDGQRASAFDRDLDPRTATLAVIGLCNAASAWLDPEKDGEIERVAEQFSALVLGGLAR